MKLDNAVHILDAEVHFPRIASIVATTPVCINTWLIVSLKHSILIEIYFFTSHAAPHTTPRSVGIAGILDPCSNILLRLLLI